MQFTKKQKQDLLDLLWDYLHNNRAIHSTKRTGWGAKSKDGLIASLETICNDSAPAVIPAGPSESEAACILMARASSATMPDPPEESK